MLELGQYHFKRAATDDEFEQIYRLNHRTFAVEVPQHAPTHDGRLIDKFHHKNTYYLVLRETRLAGMVSVHGQAPYSVAARLPDPRLLERPDRRPLEVRLLAVDPAERSGNVVIGLFWMALEHAREHRFTDVYISGVSDRVEMYRRIGFQPLGPPVVEGETSFVPMGVSFPLPEPVEQLIAHWHRRMRRLAPRSAVRSPFIKAD